MFGRERMPPGEGLGPGSQDFFARERRGGSRRNTAVHCPGCQTSRSLNIRTIDRHPLASVGGLVLGLRCSWCPGSAPMPKIVGLHALPPG
jgi:hypothetical protein